MSDIQEQKRVVDQSRIDKAIDYATYRKMIDELLAQDKTTGENHSEGMLNYTRMNVQRMNKWDKIGKLDPELIEKAKSVEIPQHWLVITEAWCGDAAQNLPWLNKIAELNDNISLSFILRDENLDVIDAYLSDGGRGIPRLIALTQGDLEDLWTWGPRPEPARQMLLEYKENKDSMTYDEFANKLHLWYAKDKGKHLQQEFMDLLGAVK